MKISIPKGQVLSSHARSRLPGISSELQNKRTTSATFPVSSCNSPRQTKRRQAPHHINNSLVGASTTSWFRRLLRHVSSTLRGRRTSWPRHARWKKVIHRRKNNPQLHIWDPQRCFRERLERTGLLGRFIFPPSREFHGGKTGMQVRFHHRGNIAFIMHSPFGELPIRLFANTFEKKCSSKL